jgi:hypothetical protein
MTGPVVSAGRKPPLGQAVGDHNRILVLPYVQRFPSHLSQELVVAAVARLGGLQFGGPPGVVRFGLNTMVRTGVPEAAIHEHGHSEPYKGQVGTSGQILPVKTEPDAAGVEGTPQGHLRAGVHGSLPGHEPPHGLRGRLRPRQPFSHTGPV